MVKVKEDLSGKRFGRLVVLYQAEDRLIGGKKLRSYWHCRCDCGNEKDIQGTSLKNGRSTSCGCYGKEVRMNNMKRVRITNKKYNNYDLNGEQGIGYTTNGVFYFDKEDYDLIKDYCWTINKEGYVASSIYKNNRNTVILMHRLLLSSQLQNNKKIVDHINQHRNDNRKSNLRVCTHAQNHYNIGIVSNNTSGVTGVNFHKCQKKWRAYIRVDGKHIELGHFDDFNDAVKARRNAEKQYCKNFDYISSRQISNVIEDES